MRIVTILTAFFLPWAAYDQNLFRRRRERLVSDQGLHELREQKEVKQHKRLTVVPPWLRAKKPVLRMKCNHFSGKSRDWRDSNQRAIRRKFNNL